MERIQDKLHSPRDTRIKKSDLDWLGVYVDKDGRAMIYLGGHSGLSVFYYVCNIALLTERTGFHGELLRELANAEVQSIYVAEVLKATIQHRLREECIMVTNKIPHFTDKVYQYGWSVAFDWLNGNAEGLSRVPFGNGSVYNLMCAMENEMRQVPNNESHWYPRNGLEHNDLEVGRIYVGEAVEIGYTFENYYGSIYLGPWDRRKKEVAFYKLVRLDYSSQQEAISNILSPSSISMIRHKVSISSAYGFRVYRPHFYCKQAGWKIPKTTIDKLIKAYEKEL